MRRQAEKRTGGRIIAALLAFLLLAGFFPGCSGPEGDGGKKIRVVATVFPLYDWVRNVLGGEDGIEVVLLLDKGVDLHSFQPSAADVVKIASSDLFLYVGGESERWVDDVLLENEASGRRVVDLMELLGPDLREEEITEGMEEETEEPGETGPAYDEHVWLSLRLAEKAVGEIAAKLGEIDPDRRELYDKNASDYAEKLRALDGEFADAVRSGDCDTLVVADRFPFRYLAEDYDLRYYAAFPGCSAESEASFQTVVFLAGKVDELQLPAVLTLETGDQRLAETVAENVKGERPEILVMNSLQAAGIKDAEQGLSYLGVMKENLKTLKKALSR